MFSEACSTTAPLEPASEGPENLAFGRFQVLPQRRELLADGQPVALGGRAFDVLMALIEARGVVLSKDALMARVWPDRIVEENNLQVQISALRAALGPERALIRTVPRRGYQFSGGIRVGSAAGRLSAGLPVAPELAPPPSNVPEPVSELIGRDEVLREILDLAETRRLVTLTGAGGIGKTRLALAVARRRLPHFADGVWLAELSPLAGDGSVGAAVVAALELNRAGAAAAPDRVAAALTGKALLLVLDNCEHVVGGAAILAEALLRANPKLHIIATSREPLNAEGEWVYPVPPLAVPAEDAGEALGYGAVRLFLDRARAANPRFAPDRRLTAMIATICRRLDGLPLAIELAAARAAMLGIEGLAARLDDCLQLLGGGRRTALPRQQTLRATLDWSYGLLDEPERVVLRRLAVFAGGFSLAAAGAVAAQADLPAAAVVDRLSRLVAKSLVAANVQGSTARFRLLDTTRAYALEKLLESGEHAGLARRHAEYVRDLFERAESEWDGRATGERLADYLSEMDNLRAALDWALAPDGDAALGAALSAAAAPLWAHVALAEGGPSADRAGDLLLTPGLRRGGVAGAGDTLTADGDIGRVCAAFSLRTIVGAGRGDEQTETAAARVTRWPAVVGRAPFRDHYAIQAT